jgi:hypothetical protein
MSLINMTASTSGVQKTAGCSGCPDASGVSSQQVANGATLTFKTPETSMLRLIGLGSGGVGSSPASISFALRLQNGIAEVRETGSYKAEVRFNASDTLQIAVSGGSVRYLKNGVEFYRSSGQVHSGLRVHAIFYDLNAALTALTLQSPSGGG